MKRMSPSTNTSSNESEKKQRLSPPLNELPTDVKISDLFPNSEENLFNIATLRKLMILFIHHCQVFEMYLAIKTQTGKNLGFETEEISKLEKILILQLTEENLCFKISEDLIKAPFKDLVEMISIARVQKFIALANVQFQGKQINRNVIVRTDSGELKEFEMTLFEKENLLLAKCKRKDERIKFVFKSIRKQIFQRFRNSVKNGVSVDKMRKNFNNK